MEQVRLGTIGSGVIVHSVLDNVMKTDGIVLEAVFSRSAEKGEALAKQYGATKVYDTLEALLEDDAVNTVYIATPNLLHYEQTKKALQAGKHVICEKPFVTRADQAEELFALAEEKNLMLVEAAPTTFLPNYQILKDLLPKIGRIRLVMGNYSQYSSRYDELKEGKLPNIFNAEFAGGCLMDINFYNVYLCIALFGVPAVAKYSPNLYEGSGVDTSGIVSLSYDDMQVTLCGAKDTFGVNFFQIEGEKGYIYVENGPNGLQQIRFVTKEGSETFNEQDSDDRWFYEVQNLTPVLLQEDMQAVKERAKITTECVRVIESMRRDAGIQFPGD